MSLKNNVFVSAAALALGMAVSTGAGAGPVCDALLNDLSVTSFGIAEVDVKGRVVVLVGITGPDVGGVTPAEVVRPVCDSKGDVRLFTTADAAIALSKRSNIGAGVEVVFVKMAKVASIGDPVLALKNKHKAFKAENLSATTSAALMVTKIAAADGLGWDTAANGTPESDEYQDLMARQDSVGEWVTYTAARLATLAAALTAAGIDPATYLPL